MNSTRSESLSTNLAVDSESGGMRFAQVLRHREKLFWVLHITGWGGFAFAAYLGALAHEKPVSYNWYILWAATSGLVLTLPLRYIYRALWNKSPAILAFGAVALSYIFSLGWIYFRNQVYWSMYKQWYTPDELADYFSGATGATYVLLCWSGLYFGIKYYKMLQHQTEKTLLATAMAHQSQLKMLRYQLNPHFLFNTLNAISTLILDRDNQTANTAVTRLSDFLRYTLDNDPMKKVTLKQELSALDLYLRIEKVRFQERLHLKFEVEDEALTAMIPSLILQPLIENAVKYTVAPREEGGSIEIRARLEDDYVEIDVLDDGPGLDIEAAFRKASRGVGLKNTQERLLQLYGDRHRFMLENREPHGLHIYIRIPFDN